MRFDLGLAASLGLGLAVACSAFPIAAVRAEAPGTIGIIGTDDRRPIRSQAAPWGAIGQVNIGGYRMRGSCTGTLIAQRLVLTAAHCVIDPRRGMAFPAHDIHFLAGVQLDKSIGAATAACVKVPPARTAEAAEPEAGPKPILSTPLERFASDMAVIVLDEPIAAPVMPLARPIEAREGLALRHASYPADRRYQLMGDAACSVQSRAAGIWLTDCDSHVGSSGGPVMVETEGRLEIVAVMAGATREATIAVPLARWPGLPLGTDCPPSAE